MKVWLAYLSDKLRGSFWFVPALMSAAAVLLAAVLPQFDQTLRLDGSDRFGWLKTTVPAARTMLSALAAATVTAVTVVFSITMVTLSLTTQQFGPRLLRRFTQNRVTQFSLGAFLATSLYCLLLLRWLDEAGEEPFVPHLAVAAAVLLAIVSFAALIWFIHDMSVSIQAQNVVKSVADDLNAAIVRLFPEEIGTGPEQAGGQAELERRLRELGDDYRTIPARDEGYVEAVDNEGLLSLAGREDVVLELLIRPGDFIVHQQPLARVWRAGRPGSGADAHRPESNEDIVERLNQAVITGTRRTPRQDVECAINELVEVAVRALSPGINDPFTAIASIDRLGAALTRLARRRMPSPFRCDSRGRLRVIALPVTFPEALAAAFNQIRQYGRTSAAVTIRLMEALGVIASAVRRDADRAAVRHHAQMIRQGASEALPEPSDRADLERRHQRVVDALAAVTEDTTGPVRPGPSSLDSPRPEPLAEYLPHHDRLTRSC